MANEHPSPSELLLITFLETGMDIFWKWIFQHSLLTESFLNSTCKFQFQLEFQSKDQPNQSIAVRKFYCLIVNLVFFWQCFLQIKISDYDNETILRNNSLLSLKVQYRLAIVPRKINATHVINIKAQGASINSIQKDQ